jgi:hypothetical protein
MPPEIACGVPHRMMTRQTSISRKLYPRAKAWKSIAFGRRSAPSYIFTGLCIAVGLRGVTFKV